MPKAAPDFAHFSQHLRSRKFLILAVISLALVGVALLAIPPHPPSTASNLSDRAIRVFYRGETSLEWGTVCRLRRDAYVSVHHVTKNGTPLIGPKTPVTRFSELSDWSFLGIDPKDLDAAHFPALAAGQPVTIHGFPARDRDGEVIPGIVYTNDTIPPFWWIELHDRTGLVVAEGVIGGISGSCVLDSEGRVVAVVHANGFSRIAGTTNTWAMVIPLRDAIREAQDLPPEVTPPVPFIGKILPSIEAGRWRAGR